MNYVSVVVFIICLWRIHAENVSLNPGQEQLYSILTGDNVTLHCPVNSSRKSEVRWTYMTGTHISILSIGEKLNLANFRFSVGFTNHLQNVTYLRIYKITSKEQHIYTCYYPFKESKTSPFIYEYNIRLANVTNSLIKNESGTICCIVHGQHLLTVNFIWEQRTLFDQHVRFIDSSKDSLTSGQVDVSIHNQNNTMSCLNLNINKSLSYKKEGKYTCIAQLLMYGRNHTLNKTTSVKIENKKERPLCIQDPRSQFGILGANLSIDIQFYSKSEYTALSFRKNNCELKLRDTVTVYKQNISLNIYDVTVMVSGYELSFNITEFSEKDIGHYTVDITNAFGYSNCTVWLTSKCNHQINNTVDKVEIDSKKGFLELQSLLVFGILTVSFIILVASVICNIFIHLYYKKLSKVSFEIEENDMSRQSIGTTETENLYHSIIDDTIRPEHLEMYHSLEVTSTNRELVDVFGDRELVDVSDDRESRDIFGVQNEASSGENEPHIEEDDYLHPYCTVIQNTVEVHEYQAVETGLLELGSTDEFSNQDEQGSYENIDIIRM